MKHFNLLHSMAFVFIAMLSLGFTSCTEEELKDRSKMPSDAIKFTVSEAKTGTRISLDSKNFRQHLKSFYVSAFPAKTYQGMIPDNDFYMKDVEIVNDGKGNFSYRKDEKAYPWPTYPLNFVAVNDRDNEGQTPFRFDGDKLEVGWYKGGSVDYVCAYTTNQDKSKNNGTVNLQFHHLMSQIRFYVANKSSTVDCYIKRMGLKGVHDDATFYIDNQGNITADYGNDDVGIGDYSFDVLNYQDDQNPVFMNPDHDIFISPMNQRPWDPKSGHTIESIEKGISESDPSEVYAYVWLECKIKQQGKYVVGSESSYGKTYFPFKAHLKSGKRYKYTIIITDDFIGYPDQKTKLQEPKLGWVISDAGNIYRYGEDAAVAGENPVAMIAYINENGTGPAPYSKHGLAISLRWLLKNNDDDLFFSYSDLENINTWILQDYKSLGKAPSWTQWYVPGFGEFDLIFDACGGTQYDGQLHYKNQPWDYGDLDKFLELTAEHPCEDGRGCQYIFHHFDVSDLGNNLDYSRYWLNPSENIDPSKVWLYSGRTKQYWQWSKQSTAGVGCLVRPVFEF